jgi:aryl-alcohol dehydrogenase (NADP+)
METLNLGRSGLKVSRLCLGTMIFGSQRDERESFEIMDCAGELGFTFIDVADVYPVPASVETAGRTEEIVGRWLRGKRSDYVLATKCVNRVGPGANDSGGGRKHVIEACEASLRRLQTERIDLFYLHHAELEAPLEETLEALDRLVRDGKVHYLGVSNFEAWQLALGVLHVSDRELTRVAALQPRYNLLSRPCERDLLPLCRELGIGVVPYNPLGAGMLTGKYRRGQPVPEESRFALGDYGQMYQGRYWQDAMFDVVEAVVEVGREEGMTPAQVAIAWLLAQDGVTSPIVGASRPEQLRDSSGALGKKLPPEALKRLDEVSSRYR